MKKIFVAFVFNGGTGNGVFHIEDDEMIDCIEVVNKIQKEIEKENNISGVLISNIIKLPIE